MREDDIYRTSTQYRLWSFTKENLDSIRANSNAVASARVRDAVRRAQEARRTSATSGSDEATNGREIECLTPDDELELVQYYCEKTLELGDEYKPPLPTTVRV